MRISCCRSSSPTPRAQPRLLILALAQLCISRGPLGRGGFLIYGGSLLAGLPPCFLCRPPPGQVGRLLVPGEAAVRVLDPPPAASAVGEHVERGHVGGGAGAVRGEGGRGGRGLPASVPVRALSPATGRLAHLGDQPGGQELHPSKLSVLARAGSVVSGGRASQRGVSKRGRGESCPWLTRDGSRTASVEHHRGHYSEISDRAFQGNVEIFQI